jgi:hypothetical protein
VPIGLVHLHDWFVKVERIFSSFEGVLGSVLNPKGGELESFYFYEPVI